MNRDVRRQDRVIPHREALDLLRRAEYGVLSTVSPGGAPYGVPLNYCVLGDDIYFHSALEGRKLDALEHEERVSFCVVGSTELMPEKFGTTYESVILSGHANEVFGADKQAGLEGLLRKYSPGLFEEGLRTVEALSGKIRVFRIAIDRLTGKARRG